MMKRLLAGFLAGLMGLLSAFSCAAQTKPQTISAQSALVMDAATGIVLFEKNPDQKRPMASTTKIMTTLLALENADLQQQVVTTKEMVTVEGSGMGLLPGDSVTMEGLCYGMMLASGNDAANTVAIALEGSLSAFADTMNQKAAVIGMGSTHFVTPSGLDAQNHYSTAYDMALLMRYAMSNPQFAAITSAASAAVYYGNPPYRRVLTNHNRLLTEYEGCIGGKTGFTKKSGRCLVSVARQQDATLICVTLSAPDDWGDHKALLDYGFSQMERITIDPQPIPLPVVGGQSAQITATTQQITVTVPQKAAGQITTKTEAPPFLYAPVKLEQAVGRLVVLLDGVVLAQTPLLAQTAVSYKEYRPNLWQRFCRWLRRS